MDADSYYVCTPQQVNSFMQWLCLQAGTETPVSVARLAMGTWVSEDGQTLEVTEFSLNGVEMYLNNTRRSDEGTPQVEYLTPDGYGYFEPSANGATMTVYSCLLYTSFFRRATACSPSANAMKTVWKRHRGPHITGDMV